MQPERLGKDEELYSLRELLAVIAQERVIPVETEADCKHAATKAQPRTHLTSLSVI